jgi:hypothetical protein
MRGTEIKAGGNGDIEIRMGKLLLFKPLVVHSISLSTAAAGFEKRAASSSGSSSSSGDGSGGVSVQEPASSWCFNEEQAAVVLGVLEGLLEGPLAGEGAGLGGGGWPR